jgi:hypothetical protein
LARRIYAMADSYLRLIPAAVADAIMATVSVARKRFAVACANVAVEHCVRAGLGGDGDGELGFAPLREQVLAALEPRQIEEIDRMLGRREDHLYGLVAALRANDNEAPYSEFLRLATQRHTIRALRATLLSDGLSAAARAAFETISATRNEQHIEELAREIMRPA